MKRASFIFLVVGGLAVAVTVASWFIYPEWKDAPAGIVGLIVAAASGTLVFLKGLMDVLKSFKELRKPEKEWEEKPLQQTNPKKIRGDMGNGGKVSYIDRGATGSNLLHEHPRLVIVGPMKIGKTREAAEVIDRAIQDDLIQKEDVYEPSQTLRRLPKDTLAQALKWDFDSGRRALLFIDDLPMEIRPGETEKWSEVLRALKRCVESYVVATARSDQLSEEQKKWLQRERFYSLELKELESDEVDELVLAASGVFNLTIGVEARQVFVENSDGRPETTLAGLRRLAREDNPREIDVEKAQSVAKDGLEATWARTITDLEESSVGAKYWLEAIATFHHSKVSPHNILVSAYAIALWRDEKRWTWRRRQRLDEALVKMAPYGFRVREGNMRYPEVAVEKCGEKGLATEAITNFLRQGKKKQWRKRLSPRDRAAYAWGIADLAYGKSEQEGCEREAVELLGDALSLLPHPDFYLNRGNIYDEMGQYERAIVDYNKAIKLAPDYALAYFSRGNHNANQGQNEPALKDYNKAIELAPDFVFAYINRGIHFADQGQNELAIGDYNKAIELEPELFLTYINRGNSYSNLGEYQRALEDFDKAIELDPEFFPVFENRGRAYASLGQIDQAIKDFDRYIQIEPDDPEVYHERGASYASLEQYEQAIQDYDKAIELDPEIAITFFNRGVSYANLEQYEQAIQDYDKAIELDPEIAITFFSRGVSYAALEHYERAIQDYDKAIELDSGIAMTYFSRGVSYTILEQPNRAIEDFNKAIALKLEDAILYFLRGLSYASLKQDERAIEDYNKAIKLTPENADFYSNRGLAYHNMEKYEKAILDFNKAIDLTPNDADLYVNRGLSYSELELPEMEMADYNQAIKIDSENTLAYYNKACCYSLMGDVDETVKWLREALERDHQSYLELIKTDCDFDLVRETAAFQALIAKFGCEE